MIRNEDTYEKQKFKINLKKSFYNSNCYAEQIAAEEEKKAELNETKANVNSEEYIEEIARDKLDMYLPNEKVYIDISK